MSETHKRSIGDILNPKWVKEVKLPTELPINYESLFASAEPLIDHVSVYLKVSSVINGAPAELAGIKDGDEILSFDGIPITADTKLQQLVNERKGANSEIIILRRGKEKRLHLEPILDERSNDWIVGVVGHTIILTEKLFQVDAIDIPEQQNIKFDIQQNGEHVADAVIGLEKPELINVPFFSEDGEHTEVVARRITTYILKGEKDGKPVYFDLLKRFNNGRARIYWCPTLPAGGLCENADNNSKRPLNVLVKNPVSDFGPHSIIHELRHAWQNTQPRFKKLKDKYISTARARFNQDEIWTKEVRNIYSGQFAMRKILKSLFPENVVREAVAPFEKKSVSAYAELFTAKGKHASIHHELVFQLMGEPETDTIEKLQRELDAEEQEIKRISERLPDASTPVFGSVTVRDILRLPLYAIERDAEYAAIAGLRTIKKETGIDLLKKVTVTPSDEHIGTVEQLKKSILSLRSAGEYTKHIGVSRSCINELNATLKPHREHTEMNDEQTETM